MKKKAESIYIRVLVTGARSLVRREIAGVLISERDIKIIGQASNRLETMECIGRLNPDIVIIDDTIGSLKTIQLINQRSSDTKVLLLIKDYDEDKELAAIKMGVRGFLPKRTSKTALVRCVRSINQGEMWIRRKVIEKLIHQLLTLNTKKTERFSELRKTL